MYRDYFEDYLSSQEETFIIAAILLNVCMYIERQISIIYCSNFERPKTRNLVKNILRGLRIFFISIKVLYLKSRI